MTTVQRDVLGLAAGVLVGLLVTWVVLIPWVTRNVKVLSETEMVRTAPCENRLVPLQTKLASLKQERDTLKPQWETAGSSRLKVEGDVIAWPEDVSDMFRRPAIEVLLTAAIEKSRAKVVVRSWHCDEFPCLVALEGRSVRQLDAVLSALMERGFTGLEVVSQRVKLPAPKRSNVLVLSYWDKETEIDALRQRVGRRMAVVIAKAMAEGDADVP